MVEFDDDNPDKPYAIPLIGGMLLVILGLTAQGVIPASDPVGEIVITIGALIVLGTTIVQVVQQRRQKKSD